jgi:ATP-dependent Clp protease adaptor protein ClpS
MVGVAQLVEHWLVVPVAAGSSPVIHPMETVPAPPLIGAGGPVSSSGLSSASAVRLRTGAGGADTDVLERPDTIEQPTFDTPWLTIVWNDPVNLMNYVTHVFRTYFGFTRAEAEKLMLQVHHEGKAVVASGNREEMERHVEAMHDYGLWATVGHDG